MKYLLAVSGGIDSVVLLDMLVRDNKHELIVAHFDHGIREDSADDARFVGELARHYGLVFETKREELGKNASEDVARSRRYAFLTQQAKKHQATIVTAHHSDDILETIAINSIRGTGWRGLAVLDRANVARPLLHLHKEEIRTYARVHRLEWVEDSTNAQYNYLRNRVRRTLTKYVSDVSKKQLLELWQEQVRLKGEIDQEIKRLSGDETEHSRYFMIQIEPVIAQELLRAIIFAKTQVSPTRPQLERALLAIKTARASTIFQVGDNVSLYFSPRTFVVQTP